MTDALEETDSLLGLEVGLPNQRMVVEVQRPTAKPKSSATATHTWASVWWLALDWEESLVGHVGPRYGNTDILSTSSSL